MSQKSPPHHSNPNSSIDLQEHLQEHTQPVHCPIQDAAITPSSPTKFPNIAL